MTFMRVFLPENPFVLIFHLQAQLDVFILLLLRKPPLLKRGLY
jgi:hypothetical protein